MDFLKDNKKAVGIVTVVVIIFVVIFVWKPWNKDTSNYMPRKMMYQGSSNAEQVAEIAPVGASQLDGDIPGHLASINDPTFMTTPSIVLSTTSRIGENLKYKGLTTDIRGSIPRVYGGSGSPFNQNIQLEDTNIDPDTY